MVARRKSTLTLRKVVLKWSRLDTFCLNIGYPKIRWFLKLCFPENTMAYYLWVGVFFWTHKSIVSSRWIFMGYSPMDRPSSSKSCVHGVHGVHLQHFWAQFATKGKDVEHGNCAQPWPKVASVAISGLWILNFEDDAMLRTSYHL